MRYPEGLVALLSYIWFAPAVICATYIGMEIQDPEKKWYLVGIYTILGVIFNIVIFLDPISSFYLGAYAPEGEGLIDYNINLTSVAGMILALMLIPYFVVLVFGIFSYSKKTRGTIRKQFLLLGIGIFGFFFFGIMEGFFQPGLFIIFVRIGYIGSFWFMYLALTRTITS